MEYKVLLVLNVPKVKELMAAKRLHMKDLGRLTGRDVHTLRRYFDNPEKVRLDTVSELAEALGVPEFTYDELIVRVSSEEQYERITKAHGYGR